MIRIRFGRFGLKKTELILFFFNLKEDVSVIKAKGEVNLVIGDQPASSELIKKSTIDERLSSGEVLFLAKKNSCETGYLFATRKRCWVAEIGDWLEVNDSEVYLYDAFTREEFRGQRIYPFLISEASCYFKKRGLNHAVIFSTASNVNSINGIIRAEFIPYQTVQYLNLCGLRIWRFGPRKYDVRSQFAIEA